MALLSTFEASARLSVLLAFFVICGFANDSRSIHSIVILRGKTQLGRCTISWSTPILIIGSEVIASRAMPNPSRSLPLSLSLGTVIERSVFRVKRLGFQVNLLLALNCSSPLFIGFGVFHFDASISERSWKTKGESSKICVVVHIYVGT